jgi:hypothetical protein
MFMVSSASTRTLTNGAAAAIAGLRALNGKRG